MSASLSRLVLTDDLGGVLEQVDMRMDQASSVL